MSLVNVPKNNLAGGNFKFRRANILFDGLDDR